MGTTTTAISIDRFRRRGANPNAADAPVVAAHPLEGSALGVIARHYGLMVSEETILVAEVIATSGDLAVADRLAFLAANERHEAIAVLEVEGWYLACRTERTLRAEDLAHLRAIEGAPRLMSLVTERGITPALGPLCA